MTPEAGIAARARAAFAPQPPARLGVAVSGGGDSVALLVLLADWAAAGGPQIAAVTVDHRLRPESRSEAETVAALCARLGVGHAILDWTWDGQGNLADAARRGRQALIAGWAAARGLADVAIGHTRDDQAETLLMRLARGSGVDGLAAMAPRRVGAGLTWWRPLLTVGRDELRAVLRARGIGWADDPTNEDPTSHRILARRLIAGLEPLGLSSGRLAQTAEWMRLAQEVLDAAVTDLARASCRVEAGSLSIDRERLAAAPRETSLRLLAGAVRWMGQQPYRPRLAPLAEALDALLAGRRRTLGGAVVDGRARRTIRLSREPAATGGAVAVGALWDGRWRVDGPRDAGLSVAALGEAGLALCPGWRDIGLPRPVLEVSPAVWRGATLVAAPLVHPGGLWRADCLCGEESLLEALIAH